MQKTQEDFIYHYGYSCERCSFFFNHYCKKNPPLIILDNRGAMNSYWPTVRNNDWCYSYEWCGSELEKLRGLKPLVYKNGRRIE